MNRRNCLAAAALAAALALATLPSAADATAIEDATAHLNAGRLADAAAVLDGHLAEAPDDDTARFALGAVQFGQAVERLGQALYRHGLEPSLEVFAMPFFRLPVPYNPTPAPIDYDKARAILARFVRDLAIAEATLAQVEDAGAQLPLAIGLIRLDLDGDGVATEGESLWRLFQAIGGAPAVTPEQAAQYIIDFDGSDAPWLRGYSHLLMGMGEFLLAHDWRDAFDHTFHALFPRAGLPYALLADKTIASPDLAEFAEIADLVAFIHLNHWPVAEPARMGRVLGHLESMVELSRENWRRVLAETDAGREWLPNPKQTGAIPGLAVTQERIDGWMLFLDEFGALLQGEKLMPHWRLARGVNLRRVFLEPRAFDIVLWIQGSAALPYAEDGPISSRGSWEYMMTLFQGDFFTYAMWFN
jgi:hypothetical protein